MKATRVVLRMTEQDVAVDAFPTPVPGLVVHQAAGQPGYWAVTHVVSGAALSSYLPSPEAALGCAASLGMLADWTQSLDCLRGRVPRAGEILEQWGSMPAPADQVIGDPL